MPSSAEAAARPWPRPPPSAARPTARPAPIARPRSRVPPPAEAPASCAKAASPANSNTAPNSRPVRTLRVRYMDTFLRLKRLLLMFFVRDSQADVGRGHQGEDQSLDHRHENPEQHQRKI